jgi:hypothetical protein
VRMASRTQVVDAPSGFRALSREAARRLHVHGSYTYTLETIIAAGRNNMAVTSVPVRTNADLRPSRLVRNLPDYVVRSAVTILRSYATYRPFAFFVGIGTIVLTAGVLLGLRYLHFAAIGEGDGHVQSVILAALLTGMGVLTGLIGILADLISVNRRLLEKLLAEHAETAAIASPAAIEKQAPRRRARSSAA